jgi:hypothetical protein
MLDSFWLIDDLIDPILARIPGERGLMLSGTLVSAAGHWMKALDVVVLSHMYIALFV